MDTLLICNSTRSNSIIVFQQVVFLPTVSSLLTVGARYFSTYNIVACLQHASYPSHSLPPHTALHYVALMWGYWDSVPLARNVFTGWHEQVVMCETLRATSLQRNEMIISLLPWLRLPPRRTRKTDCSRRTRHRHLTFLLKCRGYDAFGRRNFR